MKAKLIIALCALSTSLFAQKMNSKDVPAAVKTGLEKRMQVKDAQWDKEEDNYEANFKKDGKKVSATFTNNGVLIETEEEITTRELPPGIQETLKKEYTGWKVEEIARITTKGVITYEAEVEKGKTTFELTFDTDGKLIKKEAENEERNKD